MESVRTVPLFPPPRTDRVAVEAPLELRFGGKPATVLMRTPGDDDDLVRGFLFHEGVIRHDDDIVSLDGDGTFMEVVLDRRNRPNLDRAQFSSSSCGVCGKTSLESLTIDAEPLPAELQVSHELLTSLPQRLRAAQPAFTQTGGLHATGIFEPHGELLVLREDVGRHNAFDKCAGRALAAGRQPLAETIAVVSGRIGFELVQKAIVSRVPVLAGLGAPTSLAVELAVRFHLTLLGFLRETSFNCYAAAERVKGT